MRGGAGIELAPRSHQGCCFLALGIGFTGLWVRSLEPPDTESCWSPSFNLRDCKLVLRMSSSEPSQSLHQGRRCKSSVRTSRKGSASWARHSLEFVWAHATITRLGERLLTVVFSFALSLVPLRFDRGFVVGLPQLFELTFITFKLNTSNCKCSIGQCSEHQSTAFTRSPLLGAFPASACCPCGLMRTQRCSTSLRLHGFKSQLLIRASWVSVWSPWTWNVSMITSMAATRP